MISEAAMQSESETMGEIKNFQDENEVHMNVVQVVNKDI